MEKKGSIKKVFPGGNTAKGFYSYYHNIIGTDATRLFVIKGGPGVGKSSFMKKIGHKMTESGYDVEFHQCSSDNGSLDGLVIPALKIALLDGTAPHVVDPKHPGGVDEILNFGDFWDEEGIRENRDKIVEITSTISGLFKRAYRFFAAAKSLRDDMEVIYEQALDKGKFNFAITRLCGESLGGIPYTQKEGKTRELFGSALSPNGLVDYYETIIGPMEKVVYIKGSYVSGISKIMEYVVQEANRKGLFVEVYYEPLDEKNMETIIIPELGTALTTSKKYETANGKIFDFDSLMKVEVLEKFAEMLEEDQQLIDELFSKGLANVAMAKKEHDVLETCYVPHMNFKQIDEFRDNIIERILKYATEIE